VAPSIRRGFLVAIPVAIAALIELELKTPVTGAVTVGASITGFVAFEAPARTRFVWQLGIAPLVGVAAALGAITGGSAAVAVPSMAALAGVAALTVAVSRRLAIAALNVVLAFLIAQGLSLEIHDTAQVLVLGAVGALAQATLSLIVALFEGPLERSHPIAGALDALATIRANLHLRSPALRHAIRSAGALSLAVGAYHVIHLGKHGYWIPLTVIFVLKPARIETDERIEMRIAGTLLGLGFATGLAALVGHNPLANTAILTIAAAFGYAMLLIEYALFTFAITTYIVTLSHAMGESAVNAVDERALGTAIGVAIVLLAFAALRDRPAPGTRSTTATTG
jgi:fusaric acid resistance family protein